MFARSVNRFYSTYTPVVIAWMSAWLIATPAFAQTTTGQPAPAELAIAVSLNSPKNVNQRPECDTFNVPCLKPGQQFPDFGWSLSASRNIGDRFAVTGEVGLFHNLWDSAESVNTSHHEDNLVHFAMIGPRFESLFRPQRGRKPSEARFFGQVLVGVAGGNVVIGGLAVQPGAGFDIRFPTGLMLRLQLDYCFVPTSGRSISGPRFLMALVVGVGARQW